MALRTNRKDVNLSIVASRIVGANPNGGGHAEAAGFSFAGSDVLKIFRRDPNKPRFNFCDYFAPKRPEFPFTKKVWGWCVVGVGV